MLAPQKGSIGRGSRRRLPTAPAAAAVVSDVMIDPRNTPCCQERDWKTSGTTDARRPPKRIAEIGTPAPSSHSGAIAGSWLAGAVKRALAFAAGVPLSGVQRSPRQSVSEAGTSSVIDSHQTSPSSVSAVFVKIVLAPTENIALGLV